MENGQSLTLEGNFNNYFNLQIENGQQVDVLTILTPEVMQTLINYDNQEEIEIYKDQIYFITGGDHRNLKRVELLIRSVVELAAAITQNIRLSRPETVIAAQPKPDETIPVIPMAQLNSVDPTQRLVVLLSSKLVI